MIRLNNTSTPVITNKRLLIGSLIFSFLLLGNINMTICQENNFDKRTPHFERKNHPKQQARRFKSRNKLLRQLPRGKWWENPKIAENLELTKEEKTALNDSYIKSRMEMIDLRAKRTKQELIIDDMINKDQIDEEEILKRYEEGQLNRKQLFTERFKFVLKTRKILGKDRFYKLKTMYRRFRKKG